MQVLNEPGRAATSKSYMWMYRTGRDVPPIVLYEYQPTRAKEHPKAFLEGFSGYLHVDGYAGYHHVPNVKLVGCWAHARRKFDEALKSLPIELQKSAQPCGAKTGLQFCNRLFAIDKKINQMKNCTPELRYEERLKQSQPVLDDFLAWLQIEKPRVAPKSKLGEAITYCLNQWPKLIEFLNDGRLELDNNRGERAIKPFVIGRKAWLFSTSQKGAKASAIIYSIVETAKENRLDPLKYLTYVLEQLPLIDLTDEAALDAFMPWSAAIPMNCHIRKRTT